VTTRVFFKSSGATPPPQLSSTASASSVAKPAPTIKRLSSAEIAKHHKDGQCFHCDEFFTNGHKQVCKHLFCIQVLDEGEAVESQDPTISMRSLECSLAPPRRCSSSWMYTVFASRCCLTQGLPTILWTLRQQRGRASPRSDKRVCAWRWLMAIGCPARAAVRTFASPSTARDSTLIATVSLWDRTKWCWA
jgi:hypothetical protein